MSDDLLKLFEGLDETQAKQLRDRIMPTLTNLRREIINPSPDGTNPQGAKMTDQTPIDFDHLSDDEKTFVGGELARIESSVRQRRAQAQQKELNAQYNAAMRALFNRPGFGAPTLTEKQAVRERFRAMGLTDWTVTQ